MSKRRKRKRRDPAPERAAPRQPVAAAARQPRGGAEERPPAPWGSFPLVELCVLVGIVMAAIGFFGGGPRGPALIITGLALGSLGGLELAIREHFAGYRSHSALLAGVPAVIVLAVLFYAGPDSLPPLARLAIALVVFGLAFYGLAAAFRRRAGVAVKLR